MALYTFGYRCPECAGKFSWARDAEPPDRCPLCNAWVSEDEPDEFIPKAPAIRKSVYAKSMDQTYRRMEAASIERADEAESILGTRRAGRYSNILSTLVPMFCTEMDGIESLNQVVIILASNRADLISSSPPRW